MPEFLNLRPPAEALKLFIDNLPLEVDYERVTIADALGRVTYSKINAPHALPSFPRSTVDGYAVRAKDTYGASGSLPAYLKIIGEVPMGSTPQSDLSGSDCMIVHTGGMLPENADAVVMIENTQIIQSDEVEVIKAVAVGENVIKIGEDVIEGQEIINKGVVLRPSEIGGLVALGITSLLVTRKPRIGIISSGDEVVAPDVEIQPGQVRDVNSYTLSSLVEKTGGLPIPYGIIPDEVENLKKIASQALNECDALIFTAGSSVSERDLTAQVINDLGKPGVIIHGVNVRPGKPTILAVCEHKAVIGLPGNPVSALVIAGLFVVPVIERLLGLQKDLPSPGIKAILTINLSSQSGREDWIPVKLIYNPDGVYAEPVFGKSNLIFTLVKSEGLIRIPSDSTGINSGEEVQVQFLY
jgi:molybdopterin molybdotransferase